MSDEQRKPFGFIGKLEVYEVKLVGGPCDGRKIIVSHDTAYCHGNVYRRGEDDRYYWEEAGGKN